MKTLIVEPHPDDVILSMHGILCSEVRDDWGDVFVLTISDVNGRDSEKYCSSIGAGLVDVGAMRDINFSEHKLDANVVKAADHPWLMQRLIYGNNFADELIKMVKLVEGVVDDYSIEMVIGPIGIFHPFHVIVSIAIEYMNTSAIKVFYADTPYQFRVYGQKTIEDFESLGFGSYCEFKPGEDDVKKKLKLFRQCYPTESVHWDESKFINFTEKLYWRQDSWK